MTRLSRRERECLKALAAQGSWPQRTLTGWVGDAVNAEWLPKSRELLRALADLGLAVDESGRQFHTARGRTQLVYAHRYTISDAGRERATMFNTPTD